MVTSGVNAGLRLARSCKALGHPARVAIVQYLKGLKGACTCGDIVDQLPLAQSTVSQHLKVLQEAGFIRGEVEPPRVCYCLDEQALDEFKEVVAAL